MSAGASCARCSSATSRATSSSPARAEPRLHHHRAPRPEPSVRSTAHHPRRRPRRRLGLRRAQPRHRRSAARRSPSSRCSATRRARSRSRPTARRLRRRFHSGNQTTVITELNVTVNRRSGSHATPGRSTERQLRRSAPAPDVGLDRQVRTAATGSTSSAATGRRGEVLAARPGRLRDRRHANPPRQLAGPAGFFTGVGTILFNMVVNPVSGRSTSPTPRPATRSRFEGPGIFAGRQRARPPAREPHHGARHRAA